MFYDYFQAKSYYHNVPYVITLNVIHKAFVQQRDKNYRFGCSLLM